MARNSNKKMASGKAKARARASNMRITSRVVDVRRHTKGYIVAGKKYTVSQMRNLAAKGRVRGVQVVGNHIQAVPGARRLTDLPMEVIK